MFVPSMKMLADGAERARLDQGYAFAIFNFAWAGRDGGGLGGRGSGGGRRQRHGRLRGDRGAAGARAHREPPRFPCFVPPFFSCGFPFGGPPFFGFPAFFSFGWKALTEE